MSKINKILGTMTEGVIVVLSLITIIEALFPMALAPAYTIVSSEMQYDVFETSYNHSRCVVLVEDSDGVKYHYEAWNDDSSRPDADDVYATLRPGQKYKIKVDGEIVENIDEIWPKLFYPRIVGYQIIE